MKKLYFTAQSTNSKLLSRFRILILTLLLLLGGSMSSFSQCYNSYAGGITVTSGWQTTGSYGSMPYWSFSGVAGATYSFSNCNGTSEDTYMRVFDASMNILATADDYGPHCSSTNASLNWTCSTTGTYYVSITHYSCSDLIYAQPLSYMATGLPVSSCLSCPSFDFGVYTPTTTAQTHASSTPDGASCKFYAFSVVAGTAYVWSTCSNGGSYSGDSRMILYDNSCNQLANVDDYCSVGPEISWTATYTGTVYLRMAHYSNSSAVSWTLAFWRGCYPTIIDNSIYANGTSGSITVNVGATVTISSGGGSTGTMCYWASSNGGSSWDVFSQSYCNQSSFAYTVNTPGTWIFHVRNTDECGFCWDAGRSCGPGQTVTVNVTSCVPSNDNCANAIDIGASLPYTSAVINNACATDDVPSSSCDGPYKNVWWKVTAPACTYSMTAITCTGGTNFDNEMAVFTGSCGSMTQVICNDDNGAGCSSNYAGVSWTSVPGTVYYISVGSYYSGGSTGNLQLNVTGIADVTAPVQDGLSVNNSCWITDDKHTYTITETATDPSGFGGGNAFLALVNYGGSYAGNYGGYFSWSPSGYTFNGDQVICEGGGYASKYDGGYGQNTITLVSASTTLVGNQRTVVFHVRPNSSFPALPANDVSFYTMDGCGNINGWVNWETNFSSTPTNVVSVPSNITVCGSQAVSYSVSATCGAPIVLTSGLPSGSTFPVGTTTVTYQTYFPNGAGGYFTYPTGASNQTIALAACESVYGSGGCNTGSCGNFTYYKANGDLSCDCNKPVGRYEFIYSNAGYNGVGDDYGGRPTSVSGNSLFTRVKTSPNCASNSWSLSEPNLGQGAATGSFNVIVNPVPVLTPLTGAQAINCGSTTPFTAYRIETFTSGSQNYTVPSGFNGNLEVLVVAGGGGGGTNIGGGGGGGGVIYTVYPVTSGQVIPLTVGAGGAGAPAGTGGHPTIPGVNGGNSVFGNLTAVGGGRGGVSYNTMGYGIHTGAAGGSGGGATGYNNDGQAPGAITGGAGTVGQGFRGGNEGNAYYSGGGGGAGGAGADGNNRPDGGIGFLCAINGTSYYWGGGGGGAGHSDCGGYGGLGGGGGGAAYNGCPGFGGTGGINIGGNGVGGGNSPGGNGGANTGGGGGAGSHYDSGNKGGDGGSGIVIVRCPDVTSGTWTSSNTGIATVSSSGVVTGVSAGTATISYVMTINGCTSNTVTRNVTVSLPAVSAISGNQTICAGTTTTFSSDLPTGGNSISTVGGYRIHTFTSGTQNFSVPSGFNGNIEVMVVGGGGGGGSDMGGGGGGGGFIYTAYPVLSGNVISVTVGGGGSGAPAGQGQVRGYNGGNSIFGSLTAIGGGGGASNHDGSGNPAGNGGSGGGCSGAAQPSFGGQTGSGGYGGGARGTGTPGQGNNGSWGIWAWYPGGGGGAGGAGSTNPGHGGIGIQCAINGTNYYWAGGGGGAGYSAGGGNGGAGGGGGGAVGVTSGGSGINNGSPGTDGCTGCWANVPGGNAGANTGGGGGGGSHYNGNNYGGNGGSGIVIVRYPAGTWSSSNTAVATVDASTGVVTGVAGGTATIYYTVSSGACTNTVSRTVTVNSLSTSPTAISGTTSICSGGSTTLTAVGGADGTGASYQWYADGCGTGSVLGSGSSLAVSPSVTTAYFVRRTGTCNTTACAGTTVTINTLSNVPAIAGVSSLCAGTTATFSSTVPLPTGGSISTSGGYRIHTFTGGSSTFDIPSGFSYKSIEVLVVAGGGGGGWDVGGGGGGGGLIYTNVPVADGSIPVSIGAGGQGATAGGGGTASAGSNSVFGSLTAIGGGGGGNWAGGPGGSGGSGGGATSNVNGGAGVETAGQGYPGGASANNTTPNANYYSGASGGGGAGQAGGNGTFSGWSPNSTVYGYGGNGLQYGISGTLTYYAGGGGSSDDNGVNWGRGGLGGGANGNSNNAPVNTGGGGGGGGLPSNAGGNGGSGIVIVRYPDIPAGVWSSSNSSVASVNPSTGVVTGVAGGTATIYYAITVNGCVTTVSKDVTVNATYSMAPLTGNTSICTGGTTTLSTSFPTGGTITNSNGYRIHTYTTSGSFSTPSTNNYEVLVVAGGGGGASGGGGAGGLLSNTSYSVASGSAHTVTIGNGGAGGNANGGAGKANGDNSQFSSLIAIGGGAGGQNDVLTGANSGGSGGGGGSTSTVNTNGGAGTAGQGTVGGSVTTTKSSPYASAGGGGARSPGNQPVSNSISGNGGAGLPFNFSGSIVYFAGGGGGGTWSNGTHGKGGNGSGGDGAYPNGISGTVNTGGGGGGGCGGGSGIGGNGGSGIVVVRYPDVTAGSWSSSNTAVATVNPSTGVVNGVSGGTATITYSYTCGSFVSSAATTVTVNPYPVAAGTIAGSATVCPTQSGVAYTVPAITNATGYSWSYSGTGFTIASGSNTNAITADFSSAATSGVLTVYGTNACGNGTVSANYSISLNTLSTAPTSVSGTATVCSGSPTTLTANGGSFGTGAAAVWYQGTACGPFTQDWLSQPYSVSGTTVNSATAGILNVSSTNNDPMLYMSNLGSFDPNQFKYVNIRYRVISGNAGGAEIYFNNGAHNFAVGGESSTGSLISDGAWHVVNINMAADPDYTTGGNILGWRFDWANAPGVNMEIDYISLTTQPTGSGIVSPSVNTTYYVRYEGQCNTTTCASTDVVATTGVTIAPTAANEICPADNNGSINVSLSNGLANIRYIKITQQKADFTNLADLEVIEAFTGANVALGGTATASSEHGSLNFSPSEFIDGISNDDGNMWHSGNGTAGEWIRVDLGSAKNIDYLRIHNRVGCCQDRASNLLLQLYDASNVLVYQETIDVFEGVYAPHSKVKNVIDLSWSDAGTSLNRSGLDAGTYTLNYADASGCSNSSVSSIATTNTESVAPTSITGNAAICITSSTSLTANGGSNGTGASYEWFTGSCGGTSAGTGISINVTPNSSTTYFVRRTGTCNTTSCATQLITVNAPSTVLPTVLSNNDYVWWGNTSGDWNTASNWYVYDGSTFTVAGSVPDNLKNVYVRSLGTCASNGLTMSGANGSCNNMAIEAGNTFNMSGGQTLHIFGDWYNTGTFNENNGSVSFEGSSVQQIHHPETFYNLIIDNIGGVDLNAAATISNSLTLTDGTLNNGTNLTMANNATIYRSIGTLTDAPTFGSLVNVHYSSAATTGVELPANASVIRNLTIDAGANTVVELNAPAQVNNQLVLTSGVLRTSTANMITMADNTSVLGASVTSFVDGPMRKIGDDGFEFPIGRVSGTAFIWAPIRIADPGSDANDKFVAEFYLQSAPNNWDPWDMCPGSGLDHASGTEYWDITREQGTAYPDVTIYYKDAQRSGITDLGSLAIAHYQMCNGSLKWASMGGTAIGGLGPGGQGQITGTGFTSYSPITFGAKSGGSNPLPVTMLSFDAKCNGNENLVMWTTASEDNSDYFAVERSTDLTSWKDCGHVVAAGNSNSPVAYEFTETSIENALVYYRLRQVDVDGKAAYFGPVSLRCASSEPYEISVYPNPFKEEINVIFTGELPEKVDITVRDILGKIVYETVSDNGNTSIFTLSPERSLASGIYNVEVQTEFGRKYFKLVKN